jgi:monoterpene epsilon-lactone hydrolase
MSQQQRERIDAELREPQPEAESLEARRAGFTAFMSTMYVPAGIRTKPTVLGGRPTLSVEPEHGTRPGAILYFHGGAWVLGSPETALSLTANLVVRTGVRALSVDYRLAPEHPFPAAIEDGLAAYRELLDGGTDPASVVFAGDSAGGGLSVTTSLAARAAGLPMPAAIVAFSPAFDATLTGASMDTKAGVDAIFTREKLAFPLDLYRAGHDPRQDLLSPAITADISGLPAMLLQVGTNEVLLDDATRMADQAREAEVDVILDVVAGVPHVFQNYAGRLDEADDALDRAAFFISQRLGRV